ncbi:NUDIX hydrolase [Desulforamulus reducens MI-1]|uniref:NUDIX hydrolase n=1 Tax=Desulforamulus reducens (strain ATCC BAA-1160 / DSM 100696 / MI-1) TaxID=349161 RepID=A4J5R9_DESRM|nr:NUDIX hydrolase [Desulforamulus reducens]ABO50422.1 NUDIX hydrolase [Desulforamulus reducens MI-1]
MKDLVETTIASKLVYEGKILNLRVDQVTLPNGREGSREVVEFSQAVAVVAVKEDNKVLLVKQYRYPVGEVLMELPAGKMDQDENPEQCALRELQEETGYKPRSIQKICDFYTTPGFSSERMHLFLATGLTEGEQSPDEDEFVKVEEVPFDQAIQMIFEGKIQDGKTIAGLLAVEKKYR